MRKVSLVSVSWTIWGSQNWRSVIAHGGAEIHEAEEPDIAAFEDTGKTVLTVGDVLFVGGIIFFEAAHEEGAFVL